MRGAGWTVPAESRRRFLLTNWMISKASGYHPFGQWRLWRLPTAAARRTGFRWPRQTRPSTALCLTVEPNESPWCGQARRPLRGEPVHLPGGAPPQPPCGGGPPPPGATVEEVREVKGSSVAPCHGGGSVI